MIVAPQTGLNCFVLENVREAFRAEPVTQVNYARHADRLLSLSECRICHKLSWEVILVKLVGKRVNRLKKILRILIPSGSDTYHISQTNCTLYIHNPIQAEVRKSSSRGHEVGNLVFTLKFRKHGQPAPSPMARNWASSSFPSSCDANAFTPPRSHTLKSGSCAAVRKQTQFRSSRVSDDGDGGSVDVVVAGDDVALARQRAVAVPR